MLGEESKLQIPNFGFMHSVYIQKKRWFNIGSNVGFQIREQEDAFGSDRSHYMLFGQTVHRSDCCRVRISPRNLPIFEPGQPKLNSPARRSSVKWSKTQSECADAFNTFYNWKRNFSNCLQFLAFLLPLSLCLVFGRNNYG